MKFTNVKVEVLLPEVYIEPLRNELNALGVLTVGITTMSFLIPKQKATGAR